MDVARNPVARRLQVIRLAVRLYRISKRIQRLDARAGDPREIEALYAYAGKSIRESCNRLCGAIVKAGQFLSLRQELFPEAFTRELEGLQDKVPPAPFEDIRAAVEAEWKRPLKEVFSEFDETPVASASLAQVHRAKLVDGQIVAVKVLRPAIERLVAIDLSTLGRVMGLINRMPGLRKRMNFVEMHKEFCDTLAKELDMRAEADHMRRFQKDIGADPRIVIPSVFEAYTSGRVLVMEYVTGASVKDSEQLKAWRVNTDAVRDTLLEVYIKQMFLYGFVHLDPHPGNLFVLPDGRLAILDFGMVGEYSRDERKAIRSLIQSVFFRDAEGVVKVLQQLGYLKPDVNVAEFARNIGPLLGRFDGNLLSGLWSQQSFLLRARYMLLLRCVGLLKSALTMLTPDEADWFGVLSEHALPILMNSEEESVRRA